MIKKILFLVIILACAFSKGYCQRPAGNEQTNPSYVQDMIHYYDLKSQNIQIPDSVINFVKAHAASNGYSETLALKCATVLKPIFNEELTPAERIEFCNDWIKVSDAMFQIIPKYFYLNTIQRLQRL